MCDLYVTNALPIFRITLFGYILAQLVSLNVDTMIVREDRRRIVFRPITNKGNNRRYRYDADGKEFLTQQRIDKRRFASFELSEDDEMKAIGLQLPYLIANARQQYAITRLINKLTQAM